MEKCENVSIMNIHLNAEFSSGTHVKYERFACAVYYYAPNHFSKRRLPAPPLFLSFEKVYEHFLFCLGYLLYL